tara:strand:+ start:179 stop:1012 length:834 start_codon:yes stop_codon:yes gene_type:complete
MWVGQIKDLAVYYLIKRLLDPLLEGFQNRRTGYNKQVLDDFMDAPPPGFSNGDNRGPTALPRGYYFAGGKKPRMLQEIDDVAYYAKRGSRPMGDRAYRKSDAKLQLQGREDQHKLNGPHDRGELPMWDDRGRTILKDNRPDDKWLPPAKKRAKELKAAKEKAKKARAQPHLQQGVPTGMYQAALQAARKYKQDALKYKTALNDARALFHRELTVRNQQLIDLGIGEQERGEGVLAQFAGGAAAAAGVNDAIPSPQLSPEPSDSEDDEDTDDAALWDA